MKYSEMSASYKQGRIFDIMRELDAGRAVVVNGLFLEEFKILKSLYGAELKKDGPLIFRAMEREVWF